MQINEELIKRIAKNAKLNLTEEELKTFIPELKEILQAFDQLKEVDTKEIKPSLQPIQLQGRTREDKVIQKATQEQILSNTKHKKQNYFVGPKAL